MPSCNWEKRSKAGRGDSRIHWDAMKTDGRRGLAGTTLHHQRHPARRTVGRGYAFRQLCAAAREQHLRPPRRHHGAVGRVPHRAGTDTAYLLRITAVGYEPHWQHLHLPQDTALGTISLFRSSTTLDEVAVTAEKPLYSADGEKTFYHAEDDPACRPAPPAPSSTSLPTAVCNSTSYSP